MLVEHLSVIGAALLELVLIVEPGVVIATFCCLVYHRLRIHRETTLGGQVILARILRQAVQEKRKVLLILPAPAHEVGPHHVAAAVSLCRRMMRRKFLVLRMRVVLLLPKADIGCDFFGECGFVGDLGGLERFKVILPLRIILLVLRLSFN